LVRGSAACRVTLQPSLANRTGLASLFLGLHGVAQTVAEEIDGQDRTQDQQAGRDGHGATLSQELALLSRLPQVGTGGWSDEPGRQMAHLKQVWPSGRWRSLRQVYVLIWSSEAQR